MQGYKVLGRQGGGSFYDSQSHVRAHRTLRDVEGALRDVEGDIILLFYTLNYPIK